MQRRQALRFFGATFAGMWLAGFRPRQAMAARDCSGQQMCVPGDVNCQPICCPTGLVCCTGPPDPRNRIQCRTNPHCCDPCNPSASQCLGNGSCGPGPIAASCRCPSEQACGNVCCKPNEYCQDNGFFSRDTCVEKCANPAHRHCPGSATFCCPPERDCVEARGRVPGRGEIECVCKTGVTCGFRCCKEGEVCLSVPRGTLRGSQCGAPPAVYGAGVFDALANFFGLINETAASRGRRHAARAATSDPVGAALLALAAVDAHASAAGIAFSDRHVDRAYKLKVVAATPTLPRLAAGPGLDVEAARALDTLLAAQAKAFALVLASATSLARTRGAMHKHDLKAARRQALASAAYADKAAKALRAVPPLRTKAATALTSTGATEVTATPTQVLALQATVTARGVPADLAAMLARLGVTGNDLARVRRALMSSSTGGPALIAPLADRTYSRTLQSLATVLATFARTTRRSPIRAYRGEALRIPGSKAHEPARRR